MSSITKGTVLERAFAELPRGFRLNLRRTPTYDLETAMFFAELHLEAQALDVKDRILKPLPDHLIRQSFMAMVRHEVRKATSRRVPPKPPVPVTRSYATDSVFGEYLDWAEREFLDQSPMDSVVRDQSLTKAEKFHAIIRNRQIGNTDNRLNVQPELLLPAIQDADRDKAPILLVIPAFPFKDQGAFNTDCDPDAPDLAEVALLVRLHILACMLTRVHLEYVHWVILSDGPLYAPIFGIDVGTSQRYLDRLRGYRDRLNLQATLSVLSLVDIIDKSTYKFARGDNYLDIFTRYSTEIRLRLEALVRNDEEVRESIHQLTSSLMWNIDTKRYLATHSVGELWSALNSKTATPLKNEIYGQARESALKYAAVNIAMKHARTIEVQFPTAIRATSHAKPSQVAIPRIGPVAPWNGVAYLDSKSKGWSSLSAVRLHSLWGDGHEAVYLPGTNSPLYYVRVSER